LKFRNYNASLILSTGRISNFDIDTIREKKNAVNAGKFTLKRGIWTMI